MWSLDYSVFLCKQRSPPNLLLSCGVSATPLQTDGMYANIMQTSGVSATPVKLVGVSDLMRMIAVIGIYQLQSIFSLSVLQKMSDLSALSPALHQIQTTLLPNQTTLRPIQKIPSVILFWV